ncbi:S9 family peptidase [Myxococcus sp. K38C18041901]|uniref:alpha/beta hydrolase family protein n=1 Tax=Myxococcus guangdongensis TaxID=2906760 RepID=UPI0020A777E8|nr:S9 family peptidase [Myxococcus guangdongensis]MCP3063072.1 S9 family peptidase [Myxococcus guangdongensis]
MVERMLAVVAVLGFAAPVVAQESAPAPSAFDPAVSVTRGSAAKSSKPSVESLLGVIGRTTRFKQVAVSPDGTWLAWVEVAATGGTLIQAMELGAREPKALLVSACPEGKTCDESSIEWSPEGTRLLFLSDGHQRGRKQVYVADLKEGVATKRTSFESPIASPRWSPDGASVAVLVMQGEGAAQALGPREPGARETGVVRESHPVQRVAVVSVAEGSHRFVTPEQTFVYEFAWSPDAARLAYIGAPPPGDASWWLAKLHVVETANARSRVLYAPKWQLTEPTWSPDGKQVAVIEGLMSDHGSNGGDVMCVPLDGGKPRNLTPGMKATAMSLEWVSARSLVFGAQVRGESAVATVDPTGGEPRVLWKGAERISARGQLGLSLSRDGKVSAVVRESFSQAQNLWVGPVGAWERVTRREEDLRALVGEAKDLTWKSDGAEVQGWLVAPPPSMTPPAGVRAPMVTMVHGGPAAGVVPGFRPDVLMFTARGYYVFLPNYRGSFGQGAQFAQANRRDFGFGDLRDILSGVDAVLARAPVDPARLGVTGWSYGGFMAMWAVTQTQRFRAAVAGAGISNWQSYYGTNRIDAWMKPYFGVSLYDEPEIYTRSSPINSMKLARTPTLVLHGERDLEVPVTQSHEFHRALKELGVKTQLVVYADEGHTLRKPEHVVDRMRRTVEWMDANLPLGSAGGAARTSLLPR